VVRPASARGEAEAPARALEAEEERRRRILDAATELFDARGFEGTTTDDIAAAAGITKRTLYRYMGSKEHLLFEIHDRWMRDLLPEVSTHSGSPEQRIRAMIASQMRMIADHLQEVKVFFEEVKHLSPRKRADVVARREAYEQVLDGILTDGVAAGDLTVPDLRLTTLGILGAINETYRWYRTGGQHGPDELAELIADLFLHGLAPRGPGAAPVSLDPGLPAGVPPVAPGPDRAQPMGRIVSAAGRLFREKGYHGTNTRELADAAGLTKGALFYHVGHKEEVLVRIHETVVGRGVAALSGADRVAGPAAETIARMIVAHFRVIAADRDAVAVASEEMKYLPAQARQRVLTRRDEFERILEDAVVRGRERGELAVADPRVAALTIIGLLNSTYRWYRPGGRLSPDELGMALARLVLNGVSARA
jgi:AcrR family transcriptional regulator